MEVDKLKQRIAVLEKRLERQTRQRESLEDIRDRNETFLSNNIRELMKTQQELEARNLDLKQTMADLETLNLDLRHTQKRLIRSEQTSKAANRAKSAFLANMSHELRTPLTSIIGYSELILESGVEDPEQTAADLEQILSSGKHLLALVNDILDLSKIEAGRLQTETSMFDLGELLREVATNLAPSLSKNNNQFSTNIPERLPFQSDPKAVRQCVMNLLANAGKFTSNGRIELECVPQNSGASIRVVDTGIGMSRDHLAEVFKEFTQANNSITREYGGTGLGLTITRKLAFLLGGEVFVESRLGAGSTFELYLPSRPGSVRRRPRSSASRIVPADPS